MADAASVSRIETGSEMRIGEVKQALARPLDLRGEQQAPAVSESRALIALEPPAPAASVPTNYRQAAFLAHLLAVKDQHAQTRERRRAEPQEALDAYRATAGLLKQH
jgi:hypothetical protein